MLETSHYIELLIRQGVSFATGVPDSLLKSLCQQLSAQKQIPHVTAVSEGAAVGLAIGHHLASSGLPLVYMQNSGLGNAVNPLLSLADSEVYGIPMLLLIGWRGEPGIKDEPQHQKQGRVTKALLDAMEIPFEVLEEGLAEKQLEQLLRLARKNSCPVALLVRKESFTTELDDASAASSFNLMSREEAIQCVVHQLGRDTAVVATTGMASRELYEYRCHHDVLSGQDFLTVGGMGHASQIALSVSMFKPEQRVCCLDGDGAALMHLGGIASNAVLANENYLHVLLNNGCHDSVGGQATIADRVNWPALAVAVGFKQAESVASPTQLRALLAQPRQKALFVEIQIAAGHRADLGRPTSSPKQNKKSFMEFLDG
ncbi:phosphonopyruvate decarboxylase [Motiliproteus coralliicola]|uniref:Phosphonopyruvate decarboxylase n=1 Tax=Motiliproteus coralliicola TaxID=2283196 RepID=A0A369WMR4_9GAMM|nr:phosphonopyruvate decarboxylase [Motiliproteus coralliicola]RDE22977.1 phosphonopyruvate decarboxylase [Motiliproteus coralliicola]